MGSDQPKPQSAKPNRVVVFASRLCVIAWIGAISFELLPKGGLRQLSLLFGMYAGVLGFLAASIFWLIRRQALLFVLIIATSPPVVYFGIVLLNLMKTKQSIN